MLTIVSLGLIFVDAKTEILQPWRHVFSDGLITVYQLTDVSSQLSPDAIPAWAARTRLRREIETLRQDILQQASLVQRAEALEAENLRLRALLNSSRRFTLSATVGEIVALDPDPFRHKALLNKGAQHRIEQGDVVLDSKGVVGQIIEVNEQTSWLLMLSDSSHAMPVQVNRTGVRAIAVGRGVLDELALVYVPHSADVRTGDLLVSSGLGERFPTGYPVGRVHSVEHNSGKPFSEIQVVVEADLDRVRHVLVIPSVERSQREQTKQFNKENVQSKRSISQTECTPIQSEDDEDNSKPIESENTKPLPEKIKNPTQQSLEDKTV